MTTVMPRLRIIVRLRMERDHAFRIDDWSVRFTRGGVRFYELRIGSCPQGERPKLGRREWARMRAAARYAWKAECFHD